MNQPLQNIINRCACHIVNVNVATLSITFDERYNVSLRIHDDATCDVIANVCNDIAFYNRVNDIALIVDLCDTMNDAICDVLIDRHDSSHLFERLLNVA